ncbi:RadC family protein [Flavobacterium antarcticum]|uniref:JAB domain-containing protein n=1 Tax=Flavobacterium antarcticum TaxID=271155 RepID=UPI0003B68675|nr:JAB domain-containing protein [Flavobacterium antarcticum]
MEIAEISVSYSTSKEEKLKVTKSKDSYDILISNWNKNTLELQEEFKILLLNRNNKVLGIYPISRGGTAGTVVDVKLVFSVALKCNASSIIICHNHPSGNLNPSESDKVMTEKLRKAGGYLDIALLDHIIITKYGFFSFADEGLIR